jgi:hypothetical protein
LNNPTNPMAMKFNQVYGTLLDAAARDLEGGNCVHNAGILPLNDLALTTHDVKYLVDKGLVRFAGENSIQMTFDSQKTRKALSHFELKFKKIDYFRDSHELIEEDESRVALFNAITNYIIERLTNNPEIAPGLMALGICEMLDTSEMAVPLERVLMEGLSPQAWFRESMKAIPSLALDICIKYKPLDEVLSSINYVRESGIIDDIPPFDYGCDIHVVKRVLEVDIILNTLGPDDIRLMGFYWFFARKMREEFILPLYEDASVTLMTMIQAILEERLGINMTESLHHIEEVMDRLNSSGITWASNIFRIPEVI